MAHNEAMRQSDFTEKAFYGAAEAVSPLVTRVLAQNPGMFTFTGTGTYLVGTSDLAIIDPGPELDSHFDALMRAIADRPVSAILVTHTHRDHSPLSKRLSDATGAAVHAFGPHGEGRRSAAGAHGLAEGGADHAFMPDIRMKDGDAVSGNGWTLSALYTPGHASNHLCFDLHEERTLFTGDHVMRWSSTAISPPDGDMAAYMRSLERLVKRRDAVYRPAHGAPVTDKPQRFARALLGHRRQREAQILEAIAAGARSIGGMVPRMYAGTDPRLHPAAERSVLSHLIMLTDEGKVRTEGGPTLESVYFLA